MASSEVLTADLMLESIHPLDGPWVLLPRKSVWFQTHPVPLGQAAWSVRAWTGVAIQSSATTTGIASRDRSMMPPAVDYGENARAPSRSPRAYRLLTRPE